MFFGQLAKHLPPEFCHKYVFVDTPTDEIPSDCTIIEYEREGTTYRDQFASCLCHVEEEYCVYVSEDYILYDNVRTDLVQAYMEVLIDNPRLSFIRFMRGGVVPGLPPQYAGHPNLYQMHHSFPYFYTNQVGIWRTKDLQLIHDHGPNLHIGGTDWEDSFEFQATKTCQELDIQGVFCYHNEPKRGIYHYDCIVFPHISTALVKGKWNIGEYPVALNALVEKYNISTEERGTV